MSDPNLITDELAERVKDLLGEYWRRGLADKEATPVGQLFARLAREHGVMLVDANRQRSLIDEQVYAGALFRLRAAEAALEKLGRLAPVPESLQRQADELNGDYSE